LHGRGTLQGQALSRLLLVVMLAATVVSLVATNNYYNLKEFEAMQKRAVIKQFYENELPKVEERWRTEAEQIKARIEFSRILESGDKLRWAKFTAFLNAQSEFTYFSNLIIARDKEQIVFHYGQEAETTHGNPALFTADWYYAQETQELYRIYRLPIWLGAEGTGTLLLLKEVNNARLSEIAAPETRLHLYMNKQVWATSNSDNPKLILPGASVSETSSGVALIQAELKWPGEGISPLLIVQREQHFAYPLLEYLLRPLFAVLIISTLIWLGLGRWLTATVRRVEHLEVATNAYAELGAVSIASKQLQAASTQEDEITDLAGAMEKLMYEIESSNIEQKAYLETLSMLEDAVVELSFEGVIRRASPGWYKLSQHEEGIGKRLADFIHSDDQEVLQKHCLTLFNEEKNYAVMRLRLDVASNHNTQWLECRFVSFYDDHGKVSGIRGVLRDITQTYLHEQQITHMALHDALTGLPNRVLLEDRFKTAVRQASRTRKKVGVCFIDLDHFKNVNDTLGHKAGDKLLLSFAGRLFSQLRVGDTVARWGGDEFVVLLPDMDTDQNIRNVVRKISDEMLLPLHLEETDLAVTYSMGVAIYPNDGEEIEALFSEADRAMFFAKSQGRNQICFFSDITIKGIDKKELYIQNRLAAAISAQKIDAWFQPIIAVKSGRCTGVEVLARWHDEEHGWISPVTFIPMAENLGLIHELGHAVMLASLAAVKRWQQAGLDLNMAINVSKRQLYTPYFTERLNEEVARHEIIPARITLEITESVAMLDVEHASDRLQEIKNAGYKIALDDFGTGYSSLSQLHEMHVDKLKIDISFVRRLHESNGLSMTQAIINLAHALNMETVAEGVETDDTANKLRDMGVDYFQGYHFAKPMPIDEFEKWLAVHNNNVLKI
jgi:diguanylate cyclase (GGDEF)-like protein/PAS domain S-box-containing protein